VTEPLPPVLPERIESQRLVLRRWTVADVPALTEAITASLEHLRPWMPWAADEPLSAHDRVAFVEQRERDWRGGGDVVLGIFLSTGAVIGGCGLHRRRGPGVLEIGYWIHAAHTRLGYATEAVRALTDAAFGVPGIERVEIHHDRANIASREVARAAGYRLDGEQPDEPSAPGDDGVDVGWSIDRPTWARVRER
jgi:RimJ/RimL family protein N-acetyltransferase